MLFAHDCGALDPISRYVCHASRPGFHLQRVTQAHLGISRDHHQLHYLHTAGTSPKSPFGTRNYRIRAAYAYRHMHLHIFTSTPLYSVHNSPSAVHTFALATTALAAADQPQPTILDRSHPTVRLHRTTLNRSLAFAREPQREI